MKTNNAYRKNNGRFAERGINIGFGIGWLILLAGMLVGYWYGQSKKPLISPLVIGPTQVMAKEPEVVVRCEAGPKEYLECQVYQGKISWEDHAKLSKIIKCESGWNPEVLNKNKNGTFDSGLFQVNDVHKQKRYEMLDFKKNIDFGIKLYKKQGVTPWVCAGKLGISK